VAAAELDERGPGARCERREHDRLEDFVGPDRRRVVAGEEVGSRDRADAGCAAQVHRRPGGERDRRQLGRRVGVGQAAADGALAADGRMADVRHGLGHQRGGGTHGRTVLDGPLTDHRPDLHGTVGDVQGLEAGDAGEVDEHLGCGEAQRHQWPEALPAGDHPRLVAVLRQRVEHLLDRVGAHDTERRRLHRRPTPSRIWIIRRW